MSAEQRLLDRLGMEAQFPDTGCCGMAGSFGFKREHDVLSCKSGELALLPAVRAATPETVIMADGFSCRQQVEQTTDRRGLHIAQLAHWAMQEEQEAGRETPLPHPERRYLQRQRLAGKATRALTFLWSAGLVAVGLAVYFARRRNRR